MMINKSTYFPSILTIKTFNKSSSWFISTSSLHIISDTFSILTSITNMMIAGYNIVFIF
jgi:hypothetical protein